MRAAFLELVALAALPISVVAVGAVRRYALRRNILDTPNARSSHRAPTPRGGGAGAVLAVLVAGGAASLEAGVSLAAVLLGAACVAAVAFVGWRDDRASLRVRTRMAVHVLAGGGVAALAVASGVLGAAADRPAWVALGALWWLFWTVSAINVVNFIDGIDGLIGAQLLVYGAYVAAAAPAGSVGHLLGLATGAASLGFLVWNWSPARIFLGDVGSGAYGVIAAIAGLALMRATGASVLTAFLPLAPIFLDASVTLVRRARRGERLTEAHRAHLYQRLANGPWSHARTAAAYALAAAAASVVLLPTALPTDAVAGAYLLALLIAGALVERRLAPWPHAPGAARVAPPTR